MAPIVSIIMPLYNAASTLEAAVSCVQGQTVRDWELLLVNDGSTDESAALCDRLAAADTRIRVIHLAQNGGAGPARNRALAEAGGEYVTMWDADDTFDPDLLERALATLREQGVQTVVWGLVKEYTGAAGTVVRREPVQMPFTVCRTPGEVHRALLRLEEHTLFGYCSNKLYRRDILAGQGITLPNEPLYEDFLFNAAYAPHITSLAVMDTTPQHYFKRGTGLTARFVPPYFPLSQQRVQTMWDLCREWDMADEEARRVLGGIYVRYIFSALQRHCDKRMGMRHADRRAFLQGLYTQPLFAETVPYAAPAGRLSAVMCRLLQQRRTGLCLLVGRVIHWVRSRLPGLFSRVADN